MTGQKHLSLFLFSSSKLDTITLTVSSIRSKTSISALWHQTKTAGTDTALDFDGEHIVQTENGIGIQPCRQWTQMCFICFPNVFCFFVIQFQETECEMRDCGHDSGCIAERSQGTAVHELIWDETHLPLRADSQRGRGLWSLLHISSGPQAWL